MSEEHVRVRVMSHSLLPQRAGVKSGDWEDEIPVRGMTCEKREESRRPNSLNLGISVLPLIFSVVTRLFSSFYFIAQSEAATPLLILCREPAFRRAVRAKAYIGLGRRRLN